MSDERPESPPAELWSSILDSVSSTRSIPSKQILLLGEPGTGKSTIAAGLLHKSVESQQAATTDFALGYDWADVKDDAEEDTLARLSVLTVPSSAPAYLSLVPHFLPPKTALPHTLVMVLLDWTKPWSFLEQLEKWLSHVEKWAKGDGSRELDVVREESRERLQSHLQHYTEPSTEPAPLASSSIAGSTLLPLGQGTLTHNSAGVPVIVVCTKADLIDESPEGLNAGPSGMGGMVKGKGSEWEERTDAVMQVLRTICLKYGAGLFYTTQQPTTLQTLRQYALHLLFAPPAPSLGAGAGGEPVAPTRNSFPFTHRPNTLDRDRILVPAGWDSWGKIAVLRDGFEAVRWGDAWELDLDALEPPPTGAAAMFRDIVGPDRSAKPPPLPELIQPTPEQQFLAKHYEALSKDPERDPRATFRSQAAAANGTASGNLHGAAAHGPTGVVGPMGPSSFNLPNVERALVEMESANDNTSAGASASSRSSRPANAAPRRGQTDARSNPLASVLPNMAGRSGAPASPITASRPGGDLSTPQTHEVLQNFFQSLLVNKNRNPGLSSSQGSSGGGAGGGGGGGSGTNAASTPKQEDSKS
ncbi:DLIC-domain-containing protein [Auricularia subglabra TFB-10046 SS5]|nr:DLIC-domain-containing protein [Auricularia subglabra TFB-10046 SS5]